MCTFKRFLMVIAALTLGWAPALAFHDGGVAYCAGCHTMHVSQNGGAGFHWTPGGNPDLLMYGNATDTCVRCHYFRGQMSNGLGRGPGGDFYWLTKTFTWAAPDGATGSSPGHTHGHNVVCNVVSIPADPLLQQAPGGDFLSSELGCTSCHDPHGNQNFRMLYDSRIGPRYVGDTRFTFTADAPLARGNAGTTLVGGGADETDARHTVYKSGSSEWCANCHPAMFADAGVQHLHPAGIALGATIADHYNGYLDTDDPDGGDPTMSYRGLVPFESVDVDLSAIDPANATTGPGAGDCVMCLTCHRAHASPFADAGRWDFAATFLEADSHPRNGDGGASMQDIANRYYGYVIASNQRSLCNKCHVKDFGDAPRVP